MTPAERMRANVLAARLCCSGNGCTFCQPQDTKNAVAATTASVAS